jgi:hypothetical protein
MWKNKNDMKLPEVETAAELVNIKMGRFQYKFIYY